MKDGRVYTLGEPTGHRARFLAISAVLLAIAAGGAIAGGILRGAPRAPPDDSLRLERPTTELARVAAVYRYPLGCLGSSLSAHGSPVRLPHAGPCWRYGVYLTATLHHAHGTWRLSLEAISASCPMVRLPALVRAQLTVCLRPIARASNPLRPRGR